MRRGTLAQLYRHDLSGCLALRYENEHVRRCRVATVIPNWTNVRYIADWNTGDFVNQNAAMIGWTRAIEAGLRGGNDER